MNEKQKSLNIKGDGITPVLQSYLGTITEQIGAELIRVVGGAATTGLYLYYSHTNRFAELFALTSKQTPPHTLWERFTAECRAITESISSESTMIAPETINQVIEKIKQRIEQSIPIGCHVYLAPVFQGSQLILLIVLDRRIVLPETPDYTVITLPTIHERDLNESSDEDAVGVFEQDSDFFQSLAELSEDKSEGRLQAEVDMPPPELIKQACDTLVEELQQLGTDFWICHYLGDLDRFQAADIPLIHPYEVQVLISSNKTIPRYLQALVWFALNIESGRNEVTLPFGTFLIIRSNQYKHIFGIVQLNHSIL